MLTRWRQVRRPLRVAFVGTTLIAFILVATGLIALLSARPALAASSTLTVLGGTVAVREGAGAFAVAQDGQLVGPGMTIRTGVASNAVLTYIDGSTVTIEPESELAIDQLEVSAAGDLVAVVKQAFGRTWHVVASKLGPTGRYEVRTPAATAAVRGTAFQFTVLPDGGLDLTTVDGVVATSGGGATVDVNPGQITNVPLNAPPAPPAPAPAPQAVVRITLSPTSNGVAVDSSGRTVGVQNGHALRYVPGSKVELVNGQLVLTIPTNEPGRISTVVKPDGGSRAPVEIQTQVLANGNVVANTVEQRRVDFLGTAKGGVVLTTTGVIVLPDSDARLFGAPIIGKTPDRPSSAPAPTPLVTPRPTATATPQSTSTPPAEASFLGGFQAFQTNATTGTLVRFTGEVPKDLLPPPPPGKDGCPAFSAECTRLQFVPPPAPSAEPHDLSFIPKDIVLPTGAPTVFGPRDPLVIGGTATRTTTPADCEPTPLGLICKGSPPPSPPPSPGFTVPLDFGVRPGLPPELFTAPPSPTAAGGFFPPPFPLATPALRTLSPVFVTPPPTATPPPAILTFAPLPIVEPKLTPTPTPAPTKEPILFVTPVPTLVLVTLSPAPTKEPIIIATPLPTFTIVTPAPTATPTPAPTLQLISPIVVCCLIAPTPTPTPAPTFRTIFGF